MADSPERDVVAALKADMTDAEVRERFDRHVAIGRRGWADPILQAALERVQEMLRATHPSEPDSGRDDAIIAALFARDGMERLIREGLPREAVEAEPVGFLAALEGLGFTVTALRAAQPSAEPPLDVERLEKAIDVLLDVGRIQCRCGRWPLLDNWANHRRRRDGRPHRPVSGQTAHIIAREYAALASEPDRPE